MLSGLSTQHLMPVTPNRHQMDRLLLRGSNPNNAPLTVIGAPGQVQNIVQIQTSNGVVQVNVDSAGNFGLNGQKLYMASFATYGANTPYIQCVDQYSFLFHNGYGAVITSYNGGFKFNDLAFANNLRIADTSYGPMINTTGTAVLSGDGTYDVYFNQTFGGVYNTTARNAGDFIFNGQAGSIAASGNLNGGKATNLIVHLASGGPGIGSGVAGPDGTFVIDNGTNAIFTVARSGTQHVLIQSTGATVICGVERMAASQSADVHQYQKSDGTVYFKFDKLARPVTSNTTPTIAAGTGAGTSPTISISGTDVNGTISLTSGTLPTGSAVVATITFSSAFGATPKTVMLTPANANAAALNALTMVWVDSAGLTTTTWTINAGATGLGAATAYIWYYQVLG